MTSEAVTRRSDHSDEMDDAEAEWKTTVYDLSQSVHRLATENADTISQMTTIQSTIAEMNTTMQAMMKSI